MAVNWCYRVYLYEIGQQTVIIDRIFIRYMLPSVSHVETLLLNGLIVRVTGKSIGVHEDNILFYTGLYYFITGSSLWTGGRGSSVNQFSWQDGDVVQTTFWKPNQPDDGTEACILIKYNENVASTSWHDLGCGATLAYVCQKDLNVTGC